MFSPPKNRERFTRSETVKGSSTDATGELDWLVAFLFFIFPADQAFIHEDEEYTRSLPPNPFGNLTEKELQEYKNTVERKRQGQEGLSHCFHQRQGARSWPLFYLAAFILAILFCFPARQEPHSLSGSLYAAYQKSFSLFLGLLKKKKKATTTIVCVLLKFLVHSYFFGALRWPRV